MAHMHDLSAVQVADLATRLRTILHHTAKLKHFEKDPEMLIDLKVTSLLHL